MKVTEAVGVRRIVGDLGIEIEVEGEYVNRFLNMSEKDWKIDFDGSLRGEAYELVLRGPMKRDKAFAALDYIEGFAKDYNIEIEDSGRAGVHVHINMQDYTMAQVYNVVCLYAIFEDVLIDLCGEYRDGNLFCLRMKDADAILDVLRKAATTQDWRVLATDEIRYAALNLNSLNRYGSIEFRAMRSTLCSETLKVWCDILLSLREVATRFDNPQEIIHSFSVGSPRKLYDMVFGEIPNIVAYDERSMREGMRRAQHIAFCVDDWHRDPYGDFLKEAKELARSPHFQNYMYKEDLERCLIRYHYDIDKRRALALLDHCKQHLQMQDRNPIVNVIMDELWAEHEEGEEDFDEDEYEDLF